MKAKVSLIILLIVFSALLSPLVLAATEQFRERGRYIYDETGRLSVESYLGLSTYLWGKDAASGYETVIVFPKEKLDEEQMGKWYNDHGVGKAGLDNGLAIFIFPDNSVFGMLGSGNDKVGNSYLQFYGGETLKGLDKDPVVAILTFLDDLYQQIEEPTTYEKFENVGKKIGRNLDLIVGWILVISLIVFFYKLRDGFQQSDLYPPVIIFVFLMIIVGMTSLGSDLKSSIGIDYGVITGVKLSQHEESETHCSGSGKDRRCWTDWHTYYDNDVKIKSYDFREYSYRFSTRESKRAWQIPVGQLLELTINIQDYGLYSASTDVQDNSGGKTVTYGTWIVRK